MARKSFVLMVMGTVIFFLCSVSSADVPHMINYQGKLTTATGGCLNDTVSMTFTIYSDDQGTSAVWADTQAQVAVENGIFSVLLGSVNPIPDTVFDGSIKYLGVQVESDPEMRPLKPLVSVAYAYRAASVQSGGFDCEDCDERFVNVEGPDSVVVTSLTSAGTAFLAKASGSSGMETMQGISGYAENTSTGAAVGGHFSTSSSGSGPHYGVSGQSFVSLGDQASAGCRGTASHTAVGDAYGGWFWALSDGSGTHYGVKAESWGSTSAPTIGTYGYADNTYNGSAYGGYFETSSSGYGLHYGVRATCFGSSTRNAYGCYTSITGEGGHGFGLYSWAGIYSDSSAYGSYGYAQNTSSGDAYGGYFSADTSGTGTHYGVYGVEEAGGSGAAVYAAGDMIASGAKPAVVRTSQGEVLLYAMESPEVWFEDFGEGQLINGKAHIELHPLFLETVTIDASNPMKVFIQLKDDCKGTYVKTQTTAFDVFELQNGNSNASFSYRVVAKRKGYESERMRQTDVGKGDPNLYPELWQEIERKHQEEQIQMELEREEIEEETARMEQERMDKERELK